MKFFYKLILSLAFVILCNMANAQPAVGGPGGPPSGSTEPPCWPPPCIPVDGGISLIIAAGVAFGGKKLYDHNKKSENI